MGAGSSSFEQSVICIETALFEQVLMTPLGYGFMSYGYTFFFFKNLNKFLYI